jgi:hypothetical protein
MTKLTKDTVTVTEIEIDWDSDEYSTCEDSLVDSSTVGLFVSATALRDEVVRCFCGFEYVGSDCCPNCGKSAD